MEMHALNNTPTIPSNWRWLCTIIFGSHVLLTHFTMGLRVEHLLLAGFFVGTSWAGPQASRLSYRCVPFFIAGVLYDNLRFLKNFRGTIHVADLYEFDRTWFGITTAEGRKILPDFFLSHTHALLDFICGLAYIFYIWEIIALAIYFFLRDDAQMRRLSWAFLVLNILGIFTYLAYPAAPPWYVQNYGLGPVDLSATASAAGAARFDKLIGIPFFEHFYSRNPNVFGAMPSLHVAYPVLSLCLVASRGWLWTLAAGVFAFIVAFSAVYLQHHYVADILVGAFFALCAYFIVLTIERVTHKSAIKSAGAIPGKPDEPTDATMMHSSSAIGDHP